MKTPVLRGLFRQYTHIADLAGYNGGMITTDDGQATAAHNAESFFIKQDTPLRILAWSQPASVEPALQQVTEMMQRSTADQGWRVEQLDEYYNFVSAFSRERSLRTTQFALCTWTNSPTPPTALWERAARRFLCPVTPMDQLPPLLAGHWHATADHLVPCADSGNRNYVRIYYAHNYTGLWTLQSLHPAFQNEFPVAVAIDINTLPASLAKAKLYRAHNGVKTQKQNGENNYNPELGRVEQDVDSVTQLVNAGRKIHMIRFLIAIQAPTKALLDEYGEHLVSSMAGLCDLAPMRWQQHIGQRYFSAAPPKDVQSDIPDWPWLSGSMAIMSGVFGLQSRRNVTGPLVGIDGYTGQMLFVDPFDSEGERAGNPNAHEVLLAEPGGGKTLKMLMKARREVAFGRQAIFIEPQGHCKRLYDFLGPTACAYMPLDLNTTQINILDRSFNNPGSQITGVVALLALLCSCAVNAGTPNADHNRRFNSQETAALYHALGRVYAPYPWNQPLEPAHTPRLVDLCNALQELRTPTALALADEFADLFVKTELGRNFDQPTNIDLRFQHRAVCIDVQHIDEVYQPLIYAVLFQRMLHYIYTRDISEAGFLHIMIDEIHNMLKVESVARLIHNAVKRVRTKRCAVTMADQHANTFTGSTLGQDLLSSAPYALLGLMEGGNADRVLPLFPHLTPWHRQQLINAEPGQFIFKCQRNFYSLYAEPSPDEFAAFAGI